MEITQDMPAIINESCIERIAEQQTVEEQFPILNAYETNFFRTKFKVIEYAPNEKNSKRTVFSGLLRDYPNGVEFPEGIFRQDKKYNLKMISPFGNTTYAIPGEVVSRNKEKPSEKRQSLEFHAFNDNTGIALIDKVLSGDDMGYTWGSKISYGIDFEKHHLSIDYLANLYTRRRNIPITFSKKGDVLLPQDFLDECLLIAALSNKKPKNPLYQDYGLGFLSLSSSNKDFFLKASTQQKAWHSFLSNFVDVFLPNNQETQPSQSGLVFGFHQGLYLPARLCNWLNFSADLKIGGRLSTIPYASSLDFATSTDLTFGGKSLMAKLNFGSNTMLHNNGLLNMFSLGSSIGTENFQFGINLIKPIGTAFEMYKFDDKRNKEFDLIGETFFRFRF